MLKARDGLREESGKSMTRNCTEEWRMKRKWKRNINLILGVRDERRRLLPLNHSVCFLFLCFAWGGDGVLSPVTAITKSLCFNILWVLHDWTHSLGPACTPKQYINGCRTSWIETVGRLVQGVKTHSAPVTWLVWYRLDKTCRRTEGGQLTYSIRFGSDWQTDRPTNRQVDTYTHIHRERFDSDVYSWTTQLESGCLQMKGSDNRKGDLSVSTVRRQYDNEIEKDYSNHKVLDQSDKVMKV